MSGWMNKSNFLMTWVGSVIVAANVVISRLSTIAYSLPRLS